MKFEIKPNLEEDKELADVATKILNCDPKFAACSKLMQEIIYRVNLMEQLYGFEITLGIKQSESKVEDIASRGNGD